jgi:hypothetical protein
VTEQQSQDPRFVIPAGPGTRLEQLLASYEPVKAAYEEAKARLDALTDALKAEMSAAAPEGSTDMVLDGGPALPRVRVSWKQPYRFDVKRFRTDYPQIYVKYETRGGHWELRLEK